MREQLNLVVLAELLELWRHHAACLRVDLQDGEVKLFVVKDVEDGFEVHVGDAELRNLAGGLRRPQLSPEELEVLLRLCVVVRPDELLAVGARRWMVREDDGRRGRAVLEQAVDRLIDRLRGELVEENFCDDLDLSSAVLLAAIHHLDRWLVTVERHQSRLIGQRRFHLLQLVDACLDANQHLRARRKEENVSRGRR